MINQIKAGEEESAGQPGDGQVKPSLFMERCLNSLAGSPVIIPKLTHFRAAQTPDGRIFCCYSARAIASLESSVAKRFTHKVWSSALISGSLLLAGCGEQEAIRVYQAPKEKAAHAGHGHAHGSAPSAVERPSAPARPKLDYTVPAGWTEVPQNQVSVANFNIDGAGGLKANVSIAPLPPLANRETEVVNMWRQQMGMPEISKEEADKLLSSAEVAGKQGRLFEIANTASGSEGVQRIVTVMQHDTDTSWFYKISGDDALVTKEKANFLAFIKSVRFGAGGGTAGSDAAATVPSPAGGSGSKWAVPATWKEVAPGAMVLAKFQMPPQKDATAEVTVSVFPSDTGGNLANINRWRGQLKLEPVDAAGLAKLVQPLDSSIPGAILVDMDNNDDRIVGAIVPRGGQWYFYKLRGATAVVEAQKAAFVAFARSEP